MRSRLILVALIILALPATGRSTGSSAQKPVVHGTINVVLGNQNGIVVLTDSMITAGSHQLRDPGQKLFKLDDRTVCTIAGFVGASGPLPDLSTSTSAIIHEYAKQLATQPPQGLRNKLTSLAYLFSFHLTAIASLRAANGPPTPIRNYAFQLTLVGYDMDGVPRIGQVVLLSFPRGKSLESEIVDESVTDVRKQLVWKLAGKPAVAQRLLQNPDSVPSDAALRVFRADMARDGGESLTVTEMERLASRLALYTAKSDSSVGGPDQIAILEEGHVQSVQQPAFPPPPKAPIYFSLILESTIEGSAPVIIGQDATVLFLQSTFERGQIPLDRQYFFSNTFTNAVLVYDGGPLYFDKSNRIVNCSLILGPHAKRSDKTVRHLIDDFSWTPYDPLSHPVLINPAR